MKAMLSSLLLLALAASPSRADDWLYSAERAAASAVIGGSPGAAAPKDWVPYEPVSRLFRSDLPPDGWRPFEEEDALGSVVRILGPDDPSGAFRATLTVRLIDRESPIFAPVKDAVEAMRRQTVDRESTVVHPLRLNAGLARVFEVTETRRLPIDVGPAVPTTLHQFVAVLPSGPEAYYVIRLITARDNYLDYRDVFVRFLKSMHPAGAR
jgi:hypothetical protein